MWLCFNDAFLSVVDKSTKHACLLVRARRAGDIERVFPGAAVRETDGTDYRFRADVLRTAVAEMVAERIKAIDYDNFKDSVPDHELHNAYSSVWSVMGRLQPGGPYGSYGR